MSITLDPITKGMENGPEAIMANLNKLLAAIPTDSGWVDATKLVNSKFKVVDYCKYRRIGNLCILMGTLTPTADIAPSNTGIPMIEGLPFKLSDQQSGIQAGTNGANWNLGTDASSIVFSRYLYAKAGTVPSTCKVGYNLALGGCYAIDE